MRVIPLILLPLLAVAACDVSEPQSMELAEGYSGYGTITISYFGDTSGTMHSDGRARPRSRTPYGLLDRTGCYASTRAYRLPESDSSWAGPKSPIGTHHLRAEWSVDRGDGLWDHVSLYLRRVDSVVADSVVPMREGEHYTPPFVRLHDHEGTHPRFTAEVIVWLGLRAATLGDDLPGESSPSRYQFRSAPTTGDTLEVVLTFAGWHAGLERIEGTINGTIRNSEGRRIQMRSAPFKVVAPRERELAP
jgi:hypothetical protein